MDRKQTYYIKNMLSNCCVVVVRMIMEQNQIHINYLKMGEISIFSTEAYVDENYIANLLKPFGMEIIKSREQRIVEEAKKCIIELIHELNNADSLIRKSDYLVEKMGMSYQHISKAFSKFEPITLERYSILVKMEKVKELLSSDEYSLSEIAYMMDYSSVQYLSNQFKKETGYSVTDYKKQGLNLRKSFDDLY